jgi:hypothetical protein
MAATTAMARASRLSGAPGGVGGRRSAVASAYLHSGETLREVPVDQRNRSSHPRFTSGVAETLPDVGVS